MCFFGVGVAQKMGFSNRAKFQVVTEDCNFFGRNSGDSD